MRDGTTLWMAGRAVTNPVATTGGSAERVTFRALSTERRYDEVSHSWVDGDEFGVNVVCWRSVATAVFKTIRRGDPIVLSGRMVTRRFERNGNTEYFTELKADLVGLDLTRSKHRIERPEGETAERTDPAATAATSQPGVESATESINDDPWRDDAGTDTDTARPLAGVS